MTPLDADPRWRRFNDTGRVCSCCGQTFSGVFDIVFDHPDAWDHGNRGKSGLDELRAGEDLLARRHCRWGEHRFVRTMLVLPILGSDRRFAFGPWSSLSATNYKLCLAAWEDDDIGRFEGGFGWLANDLPGFETPDHIPCNLRPDPETGILMLEAQTGPLGEAQRRGISFDRLLDIYAASGNDIRPHLMDA